ncbi:MAG: hypothetical protein V1926_00695, partial [Candidatus Peregrinibacteria bacterium]
SGYTLRVDNNADIWGKLAVSGATILDGALSASGALSVDGLVYLNNNTVITGNFTTRGAMSGSTLAVSNLLNCDTINTDASGNLVCGADAGSSYYAGQGLALQGTNTFALNTTLTGSVIDFATVSGALVSAENRLTSSGTLSVDGLVYLNNNTAITGNFNATGNVSGSGVLSIDGATYLNSNTTITGNLKTRGSMSGSTLTVDGSVVTFSFFKSCTLTTDASGVLQCGAGGGGTLQNAYDSDANGSDVFITLSSSDDSLVIRNPAAGGTDSGFVLEIENNANGNLGLLIDQNSTTTGTGIRIDSEATGAPGLAVDMFTKSGSSPHILFGYKGTFDTNLYRSSGSTLATDDKLALKALDADNRESLLIDTEETTGTQNVFKILSDVAGDEDAAFRITANGSVYSDNAYSGAGADYAEWFLSSDRSLQPGELVCIDIAGENAVLRCADAADPNVVGIVSANPGFVGNVMSGAEGLPVPGTVLVGLIGQVPARAMIENNLSIRPGDALTPASIAGFARRAEAGEPTVGIALEGLSSGQGTVKVLISRRNSSLTAEAVSQRVTEAVATLEIDDEIRLSIASSLETLDLAPLLDRLTESGALQAALPADLATTQDLAALKDALTASMLNLSMTTVAVSNTLTTQNLTATGPAFFMDDLTIQGALHAASLDVSATGATLRGTLSLQGELLINGQPLSSFFTPQSANQTFDSLIVSEALNVLGDITVQGLATFFSDVEVKGELIVNSNQAGYAVIPANGTDVTVAFTPPFETKPIVTATSDSFDPWRIRFQSQTGFILQIANTTSSPITFTWHAIANRDPRTTAGAVPGAVTPIPFPVDTHGVPVSSSTVWNACIRQQVMLDDNGNPYNCSRYHTDHRWAHPDLIVEFTYDTELDPALVLPPPYFVEAQSEPELPAEEPASPAPEVPPEAPSDGSGSVVPPPQEEPQAGSGASVDPVLPLEEDEEGKEEKEEKEEADTIPPPTEETGEPTTPPVETVDTTPTEDVTPTAPEVPSEGADTPAPTPEATEPTSPEAPPEGTEAAPETAS